MIKFVHLISVIALILIKKIACLDSIQAVLPTYFDSEIQQQFKTEWSKYQHAFENAVVSGLKENFGANAVNVYVEERYDAHLIAEGFHLGDGVVNVYFHQMVLRELPALVRPKLDLQLPCNHMKVESKVGRMFIDSTYFVARNTSSVVYARPQDQKVLSPFSLQQVDTFGKVTIIAEDCTLSGVSIVTLSGESVNVGHSPIQLGDCKFTVEISTPNSGAPPVIAPYFPKGPKEKLELILTKPIVEELKTKLQGSMYSYVNTSVLFGAKISNFRDNQQKLFKSYGDFIKKFVSDLNQNTLKANKGQAGLEDYDVYMDAVTEKMRHPCHLALKGLVLYGLETAYVSRTGGPYHDEANTAPGTAADAIVFSSMQIRGKAVHDDNGTETFDFAAELKDVTVHIVLSLGKGSPRVEDIVLTGWRSLEFSVIPWKIHYNDRTAYQSLFYGHVLNTLPTRVVSHLRSVLGDTPIDDGKQDGSGDNDSGNKSVESKEKEDSKNDNDNKNKNDDDDVNSELLSSERSSDKSDSVSDDVGKNKEFFTDDLLDKDFFTDDNLEKDFLSDDAIQKDFFTDGNVKENFFSDDKAKDGNGSDVHTDDDEDNKNGGDGNNGGVLDSNGDGTVDDMKDTTEDSTDDAKLKADEKVTASEGGIDDKIDSSISAVDDAEHMSNDGRVPTEEKDEALSSGGGGQVEGDESVDGGPIDANESVMSEDDNKLAGGDTADNFFTDDNIEKDFFTDDNIKKDFFTDDNKDKNFFDNDKGPNDKTPNPHNQNYKGSEDIDKKGILSDENKEISDSSDENNDNNKKSILSGSQSKEEKKDFFTDDGLESDFFTDDNLDKDFFSDANIKKDFFTDHNIKKESISDGKIDGNEKTDGSVDGKVENEGSKDVSSSIVDNKEAYASSSDNENVSVDDEVSDQKSDANAKNDDAGIGDNESSDSIQGDIGHEKKKKLSNTFLDPDFFSDDNIDKNFMEKRRHLAKNNTTNQRKETIKVVHNDDNVNGEMSMVANTTNLNTVVKNIRTNNSRERAGKENINENQGSKARKKVFLPLNVHNARRFDNLHMSENEIN